MKLLVAVKRVIDFGDGLQAAGIIGAAAMLFGGPPAAAQGAPHPNLAQARHHVDFPACAFTLSNGVRIEFAGLHAIEGGRRVFHRLTIFGVPAVGPVPVGTRVSLTSGTPRFGGSVVRSDQSGTYFEFPDTVLEVLARASGFSISTGISRPGPVIARVRLPGNGREARRLIARGQSCYQNALEAD